MDKHKQKLQRRRIRRALEDADLSYAEIARRVGVSRSHVLHVVAGRRVSGPVRRAIIEALGFDPWAQNDQSTTSAA
jgi:transcriptional regulator with XRE-family HTH domain